MGAVNTIISPWKMLVCKGSQLSQAPDLIAKIMGPK